MVPYVPRDPCAYLFSTISTIVRWQGQLAEKKLMYEDFVKRTWPSVQTWKLRVAKPGTTDKVAVIVLLEGMEDAYIPNNVEYVVRSVSRRLGHQWALQIFYSNPAEKRKISKALGHPKHVMYTQAQLGGSRVLPSKQNYNMFRWSPDFYKSIHPRHEHILIFELDSLLLHHGCVDRPAFLK